MERRFSTRDFALTARMSVAVGGITAVYVAVLALLSWALVHAVLVRDVRLGFGALVFLVFTPTALWQHYRNAAGQVLSLTRANPQPEGDALVPVAERLAAAADIRAPDVIVAPSELPNALAVPTLGKPLVILTSSLLERLDPPELEAVIAHEVSHLANRDAGVMTYVSGPALAFSSVWHDDFRGKFVGVFFSPLWLFSVLLMRAVSRYREYTADRGAALLTEPQQVMSALTKIHGVTPSGDLRGGRPVSALCIRGFAKSLLPIFADHPPLGKRLARLEEMARVQGDPVGP